MSNGGHFFNYDMSLKGQNVQKETSLLDNLSIRGHIYKKRGSKMIFKEKFKMGLTDIGKDNKIKNIAILKMLENIGAYHSDVAGYGANDTYVKKVTWILLDWKLKVLNRPKYGQTLEVDTWAREGNRFFTYRDFEIYDENKTLCAIATSKWTLINMKEKRMTKINDEVLDCYKVEEKEVFKGEKLDRLQIPNEFISNVKYTVIRKDIDINKHMHNLYFLDLAYEALPEEVYEKRPFDNLRIMYKKEIKLGETVDCKYTKEDNKNIIVIQSDDGKHLHAIIELY